MNSSIDKHEEFQDYEEDLIYPPILQLFVSPLTVPLLREWRRVCKDGQLFYITPSNDQLLSSLEEVAAYLSRTGDSLEVSQFSFDQSISLHSRSLPKKYKKMKKFVYDISNGTENKPIICFNNHSTELPTKFTYVSSINRLLHPDVTITTGNHFMTSCDCMDGCGSHETCSCRKLTFSERNRLIKKGHAPSSGYIHKLLPFPQISGIFECNQYCKCGPKCSNRVVQNGIQQRLAVFMTDKMGWGIMALDDIPQGAFISVYNGLICNGRTGDKRGTTFGDEYLTELDYIEVMEELKEGYEDSVITDSSMMNIITGSDQCGSLDHLQHESSTGLESFSPSSMMSVNTSINTTGSEEKWSTFFCTEKEKGLSDSSSTSIAPSCRRYFDEENCYVIDSKFHGNVGRFFNHCCSPNLFVQNVFIDTHDLRFPWVAFFAKKNIKAFSELFWDYSYIPGSVEGRSLICLCDSDECRKILL